MYLTIPIRPFPAVRSNKNSWNSKTKEYHSKMNTLRIHLLPHRREIIENMIEGTYHIQFYSKMPDSWSKNKKLEMNWKPNQNTPDIDNLFKAFSDTIFYDPVNKSKDDCKIWKLSADKFWGEEDKIIFISD